MKKNSIPLSESGFLTLPGLLFAAAIIAVLCFSAWKAYFKNPSLDKDTQESLSKQGVDTSSYQGILDSTRDEVDKVSREALEREKEYENIR